MCRLHSINGSMRCKVFDLVLLDIMFLFVDPYILEIPLLTKAGPIAWSLNRPGVWGHGFQLSL